jgi:hypothetical protein
MPLLMGLGGNGFPYDYFPDGSRYGIAERNTRGPEVPTTQPTPSGLSKGTASLLAQAKAAVAPVATQVNSFVTQHPWWVVAGLSAAYVLTRKGKSDAGTIQGTVGPVG